MKSKNRWKIEAVIAAVVSMFAVILLVVLLDVEIGLYIKPPWCCDPWSPEGRAYRMMDPNTNMPDIVHPMVSSTYAVLYSLLLGGPLIIVALWLLVSGSRHTNTALEEMTTKTTPPRKLRRR